MKKMYLFQSAVDDAFVALTTKGRHRYDPAYSNLTVQAG